EKRYKSKHDPKIPPTYSTFTPNAPRIISQEDLPKPKPLLPKNEKAKVNKDPKKEFIMDNAWEVIKSSNEMAKQVRKKTEEKLTRRRFVDRGGYGKVTRYLDDVKSPVQNEKIMLKKMLGEQKAKELEELNQREIPLGDDENENRAKWLKRKGAVVN